jgi:MFS family permease
MFRVPGGAWRYPYFVKLWAGQATSMFGSMVGGFAFDLAAILVLHAGAPQIAVLTGCSLVPGLVAGPWIGVLADRRRHRPLMIAVDLARTVALASIPLAALAGKLTLIQLDAVAAVVSILSLTFDVSFRSYIPVLLNERGLVQANSILQGTAAVTEAGGFALAGLLVQLLTAPIAIAVDAISFLVSALSLASLGSAPDPRTDPQRDPPHTLRAVTDGAGEIRGNPVLRALTLSAMAGELTGQPIGVVIMLFYVHDLHVPPGLMGPIFGVGGISALVGSALCGRVIGRWGIGPSLIGSMYLKGAGLLAVVVAGGSLPLIVVLSVIAQLTDAGWSVHDIAISTLLQEATPAHLRGRVFATYETARSASMLAGLALGALLGAAFGFRAVLAMAFVVGLVVPLVLILSPVRDLRTPLEQAA